MRAYFFKVAERCRRKYRATGKRIRADFGYVGSDYRSDIRFTRKRAVRYRGCLGGKLTYRRLGRDYREFAVFNKLRAAVFRFVGAAFFYDEFRNVCSRKGVFAYDGNVLAERYVRKFFTAFERMRRDNRRVYLYRSKVGTVRKRARAYLDLVLFKGYAFEFLVS